MIKSIYTYPEADKDPSTISHLVKFKFTHYFTLYHEEKIKSISKYRLVSIYNIKTKII